MFAKVIRSLLGNFFMNFYRLKKLFQKILSGIPSVCQTVWFQHSVSPDWVQTV